MEPTRARVRCGGGSDPCFDSEPDPAPLADRGVALVLVLLPCRLTPLGDSSFSRLGASLESVSGGARWSWVSYYVSSPAGLHDGAREHVIARAGQQIDGKDSPVATEYFSLNSARYCMYFSYAGVSL